MTTKQHVIYDVVAGVALVEVTYRVSKLIVKKAVKKGIKVNYVPEQVQKHNMYKQYKIYN